MEDEDDLKFRLLQERLTKAKEILSTARKLEEKTSCIKKLIRKIQAELRFLESLEDNALFKLSHIKSSNLLHLESVLKTVEESSGVVSLFRPVMSSGHLSDCSTPQIIDVIADGGLSWIKVVARNAIALHKIWQGEGQYGDKGIVEQAQEYLKSSGDHPVHFCQPQVIFAFYSGVTESLAKELVELGVVVKGSIIPDPGSTLNYLLSDQDNTGLIKEVSSQQACKRINLDVTTMIAYVSSLTNGRCMFIFQEQILTDQAVQERDSPLLPKLNELIKGKELFACKTAVNDFNTILETIGGKNECRRASELLSRVKVVDDAPSERAQALRPSFRVRERSKIIFGTGDTLKAITATANASFVRAAANQGVEFCVFIHDSRALTERKEKLAVPFSEAVIEARLADNLE